MQDTKSNCIHQLMVMVAAEQVWEGVELEVPHTFDCTYLVLHTHDQCFLQLLLHNHHRLLTGDKLLHLIPSGSSYGRVLYVVNFTLSIN